MNKTIAVISSEGVLNFIVSLTPLENLQKMTVQTLIIYKNKFRYHQRRFVNSLTGLTLK